MNTKMDSIAERELPEAKTIRKIGEHTENNNIRRMAEDAKRIRELELTKAAKFVRDNLPFVRDNIAKKLLSVSSKSGSIKYSFGTSAGWVEIRTIITAELKDKGYSIKVDYSPAEYGRTSYDEMDLPDSYEMDIFW